MSETARAQEALQRHDGDGNVELSEAPSDAASREQARRIVAQLRKNMSSRDLWRVQLELLLALEEDDSQNALSLANLQLVARTARRVCRRVPVAPFSRDENGEPNYPRYRLTADLVIECRVGERFVIEVTEPASTGYLYAYAAPSEVELVDDVYLGEAEQLSEPAIGAPCRREFVFTALETGAHGIDFWLSRPWERVAFRTNPATIKLAVTDGAAS